MRKEPVRTAIVSFLLVAAFAFSSAAQSPSTTNAPALPLHSPELSPSPSAYATSNPVTRLGEMVVTGTREETEVVKVPADVSVITEEDLRVPGIKGYQDALRDVPGVKINARQNGDIATPGLEVRGLESNPTSGGNVLILLDGIPQRRLSFGGPYVGGLPYDALVRMELVKGPASSLYGRGAMSGALQLFTSPGTRDWEVNTWNTYESTLDYVHTGWRLSGPIDAKSGASFSLTGSGGYIGGWQPRTDGEQGNGYLHFDLPLSERDTLSVMGGYFYGNQNAAAPVPIDQNGQRLPGISRDENLAVPNQNSLNLEEARVGLAWQRDWTDEVKSKLSLAYWNGDTDWKVGRPDDSSPFPAGTNVFLNRPSSNRPWNEDYYFSELQLSQDYNLTEDIDGTLIEGGNLEYSDYDNRQQNIRSPGATFAQGIQLNVDTMAEPDPSTWIFGPWTERYTSEWDYSGFLKNRFGFWERVQLDAGFRYDAYQRHQRNVTTGAEATVDNSAWSPAVGLSVQLLKSEANLLSAYGSWGKGFTPVFRSVATTEIVNIDPETSQSYEAGLKGSLHNGLVESTLAFYHQERDNVVGSPPGNNNIVANLGNWTVPGVEFGVKVRPASGLSVYGNYTYRTPSIAQDFFTPQNNGNRIPFVADQMFTVGSEYQHWSGVFVGINDNFVGTSFLDSGNTVRLPSYHLMSVYAGYRWKSVEVSVFANNVLDEEYYSAEFNNAKFYAFEALPRSVGVTLSARF